jgi:glycosyltransferase involved in cell wall biosynthesis
VAVSPSTVTAMRERLRWSGDIYLIPNGVAMPAGPTRSRPSGHVSLVWVGRLVAHKRAGRILPVAERLRGHGVIIDVVGRGAGAAPLAAAVTARGLAGTVRLHGFLPEAGKQAVLAGALLQLNTSQGEGWGLCVLEAAALGVPTVAYDVDGLRDAVRDGETGWLVRAGELIEDVTERAVKELSDPARRAAVAEACRSWAAQLSWDRSVARMTALVGAATQNGTSRADRRGAWIVAGGDVAEGPVLDRLLRHGGTLIRPATARERLLGHAGDRP